MIALLADGRSWQLLSDNAAERQERPIAIGLGECLPEVGRGMAGLTSAAAGGTGQGAVCRMVTLRVEPVPGEAGSNLPASERRNPDYGERRRGSTRLNFRCGLFASSGSSSNVAPLMAAIIRVSLSFKPPIQEVLDDLSTTHAAKLKSLMTLNFQRFEDVSLMAA